MTQTLERPASTPHVITPRDYQVEAIRALHTQWDAGRHRVAAVLPTGAGKTVVFALLIKETLEADPTARVLVLAHTDELITQAANKIRQTITGVRVGIVKGARNEVNAQVVVASVQSLRTEKRRNQLRRVRLIVVDECHHAAAKTYVNILRHFGALPEECETCGGTGVDASRPDPGPADPNTNIPACPPCPVCLGRPTPEPTCRVAGFTATLARGDNKALGDIWEEVAFRRDILFMIRRGYLINVRGKAIEVEDLDLAKVKRSGGDYQDKALGEALTESMAPEVIAKAYLEHASDRSGVMFCPTVASAYVMAAALQEVGITCEVVHGGLEQGPRRAILKRLESGETQVVANCMVLTEGFDCPRVSCVVVARPTRSAPLYQQMVGRGLRPWLAPEAPPVDQQDALILDVVGAGRKHDLRSLVDLTTSIKEIKENESLLEAEDRELAEEDLEEEVPADDVEAGLYRGPVVVREFDPLAQESRWTWLTTASGTRFVVAGSEFYVFLVEGAQPDTWDVAWCTKSAYDRRGGFLQPNLDLASAMEAAEQAAGEMGGDKARLGRKKGWKRGDAPTESMIRFAQSKGVKVPMMEPVPGIQVCEWTAGEVSEAIDKLLGSQRIDPVVKAINGMPGRQRG